MALYCMDCRYPPRLKVTCAFMLSFLRTITSRASSKKRHHFLSIAFICLPAQALTSVSRKRRRALFFLMFFRRTDTAILSTKITTMKRPPITAAAIRGVLETRGLKGNKANHYIVKTYEDADSRWQRWQIINVKTAWQIGLARLDKLSRG